MQKIELKRPVQLPVKAKTILRPGIHQLDDDVFSHWFIQGLLKTGDAVLVEDIANKQQVLAPSSPAGIREIKPQVKPVAPAPAAPVTPQAPKVLEKSTLGKPAEKPVEGPKVEEKPKINIRTKEDGPSPVNVETKKAEEAPVENVKVEKKSNKRKGKK